MTFRFTHESLTSLAVSAMLTSAFLAPPSNRASEDAAGPQPQAIMTALDGLRGSGWAGTQELTTSVNVVVPQSAAVAPTSPVRRQALTTEQKKKLETLLAIH